LGSNQQVAQGDLLAWHFNDYPSADQIAGWYNRNLRIFANLQRITEVPDERIIIIGGGHLPILRHCVMASPEYNLVEVCDYLRR
jgi:hypothetical protein